jgi:hypothetical protein
MRLRGKTILLPITPATCTSFFTWMPPISLGLMLDLLLQATFVLEMQTNLSTSMALRTATHVFSSIIPCIVSSAGEAEYAALFAGAQHGASLRTILSNLGYPQPPTIVMCDNIWAIGIATDSIKQKRSKAIDMRFHWVRDHVRQGQFIISYIKSEDNITDYLTKNLNPLKHKCFMQFLAQTTQNFSRGCAKVN